MKWFWTWTGKCFGYREGDELRTYDGHHVGHFYGDEVYDRHGQYLGEIMSDQFLITNRSKKSWRQAGFTPYGKYGAYAKYADYTGYAMYAGHEDFPSPESLHS